MINESLSLSASLPNNHNQPIKINKSIQLCWLMLIDWRAGGQRENKKNLMEFAFLCGASAQRGRASSLSFLFMKKKRKEQRYPPPQAAEATKRMKFFLLCGGLRPFASFTSFKSFHFISRFSFRSFSNQPSIKIKDF